MHPPLQSIPLKIFILKSLYELDFHSQLLRNESFTMTSERSFTIHNFHQPRFNDSFRLAACLIIPLTHCFV